jgi:hypothetical protein
MRHSAKKRVEQAEMALHRYRAKAAAILHAEGFHGASFHGVGLHGADLNGPGLHGSAEEPHSSYVYKILRHRETGVRVRVLDTQAADAPSMEGADIVHRYAVECQTHGTRGPSFAGARAALAKARRSNEWCMQCAYLPSTQPKPRDRAGATGKRTRRRDDIWP